MPKPVARSGEPSALRRRRATDLLPPEPPWDLDSSAKETWDFLVPELLARGLFDPPDAILLATLCELVATARAAREWLVRAGVLIRGRRDRFVTNPAWRIYREAIDRIRALSHEFGLSPAARALLLRLAAAGPLPRSAEDDPQA